jgi:hypothetical protein
MSDDLVPEEVKIDPIGRGPSLRTLENSAIERARKRQIMDRKGEMKTGMV